MRLQALAITIPSSFDPNFNSNIFEEKFNNGWLKKYYHAVIFFFFINIANTVNNQRLAIYYMGNPIVKNVTENLNSNGIWDDTYTYEYYSTVLYGISLGISTLPALLLALGLFLQYQAIRIRSLSKQESCINIFNLFIRAQGCAAFCIIICASFTEPIKLSSALLVSLNMLVIGVAFKFIAMNVYNIMMGKAEEFFKASSPPVISLS